MHVTIVSTWFPTEVSAGLGIFVARHAASMAAAGHDIRVVHLVAAHVDDGTRRTRVMGVPVIRLPMTPSRPHEVLAARRALGTLTAGSDIVHTHAISTLMPYALSRPREPWLHTEHWSGLANGGAALGTIARAGAQVVLRLERRPAVVTTLSDQPAPASRPRWNLTGRSAQSPEPSAPSEGSSSSAHQHEVRDLPVPEFAPLGTVTPVEPSAPIANLRQQATDGAGDRSRGDLPLAPAPEQADITELVKRFVAAGGPVTYRWVGAALPDDKALQLTVFRIAQEALTNVLRYAPTTPAVSVDVERHIGTVVLTVDNEAAPGTRPMHGSGKGLIGMRERASVYGGTVQAGPTPTGWRVRAVLRWDEHDEGTFSWQTPL